MCSFPPRASRDVPKVLPSWWTPTSWCWMSPRVTWTWTTSSGWRIGWNPSVDPSFAPVTSAPSWTRCALTSLTSRRGHGKHGKTEAMGTGDTIRVKAAGESTIFLVKATWFSGDFPRFFRGPQVEDLQGREGHLPHAVRREVPGEEGVFFQRDPEITIPGPLLMDDFIWFYGWGVRKIMEHQTHNLALQFFMLILEDDHDHSWSILIQKLEIPFSTNLNRRHLSWSNGLLSRWTFRGCLWLSQHFETSKSHGENGAKKSRGFNFQWGTCSNLQEISLSEIGWYRDIPQSLTFLAGHRHFAGLARPTLRSATRPWSSCSRSLDLWRVWRAEVRWFCAAGLKDGVPKDFFRIVIVTKITIILYTSSTRTRRGGSCLKDIYKTFLIYRTCMRRAPAKPVRACILRKWCPVSHVTFEAPLRPSHFSLHSSHSTLHTSHFTLHTSHFTLHSSQSTLHTSLHASTLHTPHFTLHTPHFTLHTPHFTLHSSRPTLHTALFTLHTSSHLSSSHLIPAHLFSSHLFSYVT